MPAEQAYNDKQNPSPQMYNDTHMMPLPFWSPPDALYLTWDGGACRQPIHTAFGVGIYVRCLFSEPYYMARPAQLLDTAKRLLFLDPAALNGIPDSAVLEAIVWYLADGRLSREGIRRRLQKPSGERQRLYTAGTALDTGREVLFSYKWDMPDLWAAFLREYRIDLRCAPYHGMHLWQFDALLRGLSDDSTVTRNAYLRGPIPDSLTDAAARAARAAEKHRVRVPDDAALNEMCNDIQMCERSPE